MWGYYVRNLARPLSFTRPEHQADVLVGNPPWLAYRHMPDVLQKRYQALAKPRGLWAGGKVATHQDLSDLFVARVVEQYLKPGGRFAFVMPFAVLSRRQYAGFRSGDWASQGGGVQAVQFEAPEEFARVKPPMFPVPSSVITGTKAAPPRSLPAAGSRWTGRVASHHQSWEHVVGSLVNVAEDVRAALDDMPGSPYKTRFTQGANFVPRMLVTVGREPAGPLGVAAGRVPVRSARSALEKKPWKDLETLSGMVEEQFVRPLHLGSTIVAYRVREPESAIVPWVDGTLLDGTSEHLDEYPGLARWWRSAERIWETNKSRASALTLRDQVDFQGKLRKQFPIRPHRVLYTASGQHIAACRLHLASAVIEHSLYWAAVATAEEARYLTAILNSRALIDAVRPLQSRGQHNPRHFDTHIFALSFPAFDPDDPLHARLAELAERAEAVATQVNLDSRWQFQKARRVTREALQEDGVAGEIDAAVTDLIRATAPPKVVAALS